MASTWWDKVSGSFDSLWASARAFGVVVNDHGIVVTSTVSTEAVLGTVPVGDLWTKYYHAESRIVHTATGDQPVRVKSQDVDAGTAYWVEDATQERVFEQSLTYAEAARDDLRQLEYAVSHDLMEPLRGVSSSLTAVDKRHGDTLDPEAREFIDHAINATRSMQKLLTDFLSYVRLDTERRKHDRPVDLNIIVRDVLQSLRLLVLESNATVNYHDLPTVEGDWRMLYQVFSNLISNAVKFQSPARSCIIDIQATETPTHWHITVTDNGIGMPDKRMNTIFTPFIRLHKKVPGSGIGLAIVKRCIDHHQGDIQVHSILGDGTTFRISLPKKCGT